ncbi:hypothetical protein GGI07_001327 [Coemansia sp. Benny D115]|nr:hypothetical protein GGI07_001327 [Coemansia sp. Benny D115]
MSSTEKPQQSDTSTSNLDSNMSSKLKAMKFMKRSAEQKIAEQSKKKGENLANESQWRAIYSTEVVPESAPKKKKVVYESSYLKMPSASSLGGIAIGRRSFKQFNKETDKANAEFDASVRDQELQDEQKKMAVSDHKMAEALGKDGSSKPSRGSSNKRQITGTLRERNKQFKKEAN